MSNTIIIITTTVRIILISQWSSLFYRIHVDEIMTTVISQHRYYKFQPHLHQQHFLIPNGGKASLKLTKALYLICYFIVLDIFWSSAIHGLLCNYVVAVEDDNVNNISCGFIYLHLINCCTGKLTYDRFTAIFLSCKIILIFLPLPFLSYWLSDRKHHNVIYSLFSVTLPGLPISFYKKSEIKFIHAFVSESVMYTLPLCAKVLLITLSFPSSQILQNV